MAIERTYPVIPEVSRSVQSEFRTSRTMIYDNQEAVQNLNQQMQAAFTGVVPLAKLTTGGAAGSMTITSGLITAVVPPT